MQRGDARSNGKRVIVAERILFNLLQVAVVLIFAPLVSGVLSRLKEMVQSKRGPSVFQPYWDLWKLFHKDEIVSEDSSWIFRFTRYIVFVTPIFVALLIPVLTSYPLFFAFMGDMLGGGFVLALGGFFATLAAVDTANPYGPIGASRTRMVGFLAEPVFMIVFFTVSFVAGSTIPYIVQQKWGTPLANFFFQPSHVLLVAAFIMLILAEGGRIPVDKPSGHFEFQVARILRARLRAGEMGRPDEILRAALHFSQCAGGAVGTGGRTDSRRGAAGDTASAVQDLLLPARAGRHRVVAVEAAPVSYRRISGRGVHHLGGGDDCAGLSALNGK
jgi:hypothetical protein